MQKCRAGFTLTELSIILVIIGALVGGLYVAVGGVNSNYKEQKLLSQVQQTIINVRAHYATSAQFTAPTYAQAVDWQIYPDDVIDDGTKFLDAYGGEIRLGASAVGPLFFSLHLLSIPQAACVKLALSLAATQTMVEQLGMVVFYRLFPTSVTVTWNDGITPDEAATMCDNETSNYVVMDFSIRQPT